MTIQEKNPQRGQRGGGGRLTPVTSLQAAARGETGRNPQPPGHRGHHLSQCPLVSRCPVSPARGGTVAHGALQPQHGQSCPSHGQDELCEVSAQLPADKLLSRQLPPNMPFGSYFGRGVSGVDSGRILPLPPGEEEPCRGRLSRSRLPAPAQIVPTRG